MPSVCRVFVINVSLLTPERTSGCSGQLEGRRAVPSHTIGYLLELFSNYRHFCFLLWGGENTGQMADILHACPCKVLAAPQLGLLPIIHDV